MEVETEFNRREKEKRLRTAERNQRGEGILRAFRGQIAKLESEYRDKTTQLESLRDVSVRLSDPIAAGFIGLGLKVT